MKFISSRYAIAITAALSLFMVVLDDTIVNVALIPIASSFQTDLTTIQWVVTGYFLAQAAVIPAAGYLGQRFGLKRVFLICLGVFVSGSLLCGLAPSWEVLIGLRLLQGMGGGAIFPLAQAIAFGVFRGKERAGASSLIGVAVLLAPIFGPTLGGFITSQFDWRYIFFINVPIGLVTLWLIWQLFPAEKPLKREARPRFDYVGLVLSMVGVVVVVYAFTLVTQTRSGTKSVANPQGELYGWNDPLIWWLLAVGGLLLLAFALYELKVSRDPVLDLRLFKNYHFSIASIVSWFSALVVFGSLYLLPVFLQQLHLPHLSPYEAGLVLLPQGLASTLGIILSGFIYQRLGARAGVMLGVTLLIVGFWQLTNLRVSSDGLELLPWLVLRGLGFGLPAVTVQTLALENLSGVALHKASSLFNVTRQLFSSLGVALTTVLFVQLSSHYALTQAGQSGSSVMGEQRLAEAGTAALRYVFGYIVLGLLILLVVSLALPKKRESTASENGEAQGEERSERLLF
jgi:DHA2 family multidrug resistance protein